MQRTPKAEALWVETYPDLTSERAGIVGSLTARAEAHAIRLSCLYALLDGTSLVDVEHLRAALAFWAFSYASVVEIFGDRTGNRNADRILDAMPLGTRRTTTDLHRQLFHGHLPEADLAAALDVLLKRGDLAVETVVTGGRSATVFLRVVVPQRLATAEQAQEAKEAPSAFRLTGQGTP